MNLLSQQLPNEPPSSENIQSYSFIDDSNLDYGNEKKLDRLMSEHVHLMAARRIKSMSTQLNQETIMEESLQKALKGQNDPIKVSWTNINYTV